MPRSILVTGGGGFIGLRLVDALVQGGHNVIAVDQKTRGLDRLSEGLPTSCLRVFRADITDSKAITAAACDAAPNVIVHLAAEHLIPFCEAQPARTLKVNLGGLVNTLDAADRSGADMVLFASSADVYGPTGRALAEGDAVQPSSVYGASKMLGERLVAEWAQRQAGRRATSLRIFNVYGPGDGNLHVIPEILQGLAAGRIRIGNVEPRRDFIHVDDVVEVIRRLIDMPTPPVVVNAGTGKATSVAEVLRMIAEVVGGPIAWEQDARRIRPVDRLHLQADTSVMQSLFPDFTPRGLDVGLKGLLVSMDLRDARSRSHA